MKNLIISYRLAVSCLILQFVLLLAGTFNRPDIETLTASLVFTGLLIAILKALPWLILLPGLIMKSKNVMAWMSYVCLMYFIVWVLAAFGQSQSNLGAAGVLLTLVQFSAAAYYTRMQKRV